MEHGRVIMSQKKFDLTIERLCHNLMEDFGAFENTCLIGIQDRGAMLSDRLVHRLKAKKKFANLQYGKLDITFYRDDYRQKARPLKASSTEIDFSIEGKKVILVDDVLYTGRTIQSALTALNDIGRSSNISLLCLIDRRFNRQLPIHAKYIGISVDALEEAYVKVEWANVEGEDRVLLFPAKKD